MQKTKLPEGKYAILALFKGKIPFNKLWLPFDKRAELDLRLTKCIDFASLQNV